MKTDWIALSDRLAAEGRSKAAVAALSKAMRVPSVDAFVRRARLHQRNGRYALASRDLSRAVALCPRETDLYLERAELFSLHGRLGPARKDLERAARLPGGHPKAAFALARLLIRQSDLAAAGRVIARLVGDPSAAVSAEGRFYRGVLALRRKRAADAVVDFRAVLETRGVPEGLAHRARFYWIAAKAAAEPPVVKGPKLLLCGLGLFPPYTATLEVVRALGACGAFINNISESETRDFLDVFGAGVRCVTYIDGGNDLFVLGRLFAELRKGKVVAFVTRGHPMIFGSLGYMLVERCRKTGMPFEVFGAVSSFDTLLSRAAAASGVPARSLQAFDQSVARSALSLNDRGPVIVSFNSEPLKKAGVSALQRALERSYPSSHACWMFGPKYDTTPQTLRLGDLARLYPEVNASLMLYVPPRAGRASR